MLRPLLLALVLAGLSACATRQLQDGSQVPPGEPPGIAGLADSQIRLAYGAPSFVRKDGVTEIWRYDAQSCRAFFFFYPSEGTQKVRHVETSPRGTAMAADLTCLDAVRAQARLS
ncbi:MAG: hypothetical protein JOZ55_03215 [Alphaproteobacteria bacterium]|nr:hypothetical protein [Alphaproteobacteria bacterium]